MKKLYLGTIGGIITFICFLTFQSSFADKIIASKIVQNNNVKTIDAKANNYDVQELKYQLNYLEKYINETQKCIDASQKNLDLWLKYLAFTLSVLIGYSIFNGLKSRDLAKEELAEIRRIKEEIKKAANDSEERLKTLKEQLSQIENTATKAKTIENEMTLKLNAIGIKEDLVLTANQTKIINDTIEQTKRDLQKSGIETLKNLYFAKALKADSDENWAESQRLFTIIIDLDETNEIAYFKLGKAIYNLGEPKKDINLFTQSLANYTEAIRLNQNYTAAHNNKGHVLFILEKYDEALVEFSEAIRIEPNDGMYYYNRYLTYKQLKKDEEAEADLKKANELDPEKYEAL